MLMEPMLDTYNANSALQETCQRVGRPMLARMAESYRERLPGDGLVRIADYGCSGGRNSYEPMRSIIDALSAGRSITAECILEDLPTNAWQQVMAVGSRLVETYSGNVQVLCAGTSFYNPACAQSSLDMGYSFVAVHFLSEMPPVSSHVLLHECEDDERRAGEALAARDWEKLLLMRARELKPGGKMMLSTMSRDAHGYSWREFSHLVWEAMNETRGKAGLNEAELRHLCIPACLRSEAEIMAPFCSGSDLASLFAVAALDFEETEVAGERQIQADALAPHLRKRIEAVWGGMFLTQLRALGRDGQSASDVMTEVWDRFEEKLLGDTARGWLDMRCFYLQLTRR